MDQRIAEAAAGAGDVSIPMSPKPQPHACRTWHLAVPHGVSGRRPGTDFALGFANSLRRGFGGFTPQFPQPGNED